MLCVLYEISKGTVNLHSVLVIPVKVNKRNSTTIILPHLRNVNTNRSCM